MSEERIRRLEEQVAHLYAHLGLSPVGGSARELDPDIQQLVNSGQTINAIKLYRERTGLRLAEAKNAIDAWEDRYKLG
jgi:ribosomal protein L7/L12